MRIAVWFNLPSGGGKRALFDHVRGLVQRGHHVEAWAPPTIDRQYLPLETIVEQHIVPLHTPRYSLTKKLQFKLEVHDRLAAMEAHSRACAAEISASKFDILLANTCRFLHSPMIGRFVDIPRVLYLQEPYRPFHEALPNNYWAARTPGGSAKQHFVDLRRIRNARVQVREEISNAGSYNRVLCNSYFSREVVLRAYGIDADVCYLGVDETQFVPGSEDRERYVVAVGSFTLAKNPKRSIEAIAAMSAPRPKLVWIANFADSVHVAEMSAFAEARGVHLDLRVNIPEEQLHHHLRHALAMIYVAHLEPFGLVPLEAGACGTPVVAVAEGGIRETVVDGVNGLVTDPDPASLAAALQRLADDPALARRLGEQGRKLVETKWSFNAATDRLVAKLEAELARPR